MKISYESDDLIAELKQDIAAFGGDTVVAVWYREIAGSVIYTNYDFIEPEIPLSKDEVKSGENITTMTLAALLIALENQNKII